MPFLLLNSFTLNVIEADIPKEETKIKNWINSTGTISTRAKYNKAVSVTGASNDAGY